MACPPISAGLPTKRNTHRAEAKLALVLALALVSALQARAQVAPLPPEKAFRFSARALNPQTIEARFTIAKGYYLYRDKLHFAVEPASAGWTVPPLPGGKIKVDEFFG